MAGAGGRQRFDISNQLNHVFFAELALEVGHDISVETVDDLGVRLENRFAQIGIIGNDRSSVIQLDRFIVKTFQNRAAALFVEQVASGAAVLGEKLLALFGESSGGAAAAGPIVVIGLVRT